MNTYERIKELAQEDHNISIAELERTLGLSNGSISKWATAKPNSKFLEVVADYFNVSTDYLLGRTDVRNASDTKLTNDDQEIVTLFRKHTDDMTDDEKARYRKSFEDLLKVARDLSKKNF